MRRSGDFAAILTGNSAANYYKFNVENSSGDQPLCLSATGRVNGCIEQSAADFEGILSSMEGLYLWDRVTLAINLTASTYTFTEPLVIPQDANIRLVPQNDVTINLEHNGMFYSAVEPGIAPAHVLIGSPLKRVTIECDSALRSVMLFPVINSSLIVRNTMVQNSYWAETSTSSLVFGSGDTGSVIVLDDFHYRNTRATPPVNNEHSALLVDAFTNLHFVSGSIRGFTTSPTAPGVAMVGGSMYVYAGDFNDNTLVDGSSVFAAPGTLINPNGVVFR